MDGCISTAWLIVSRSPNAMASCNFSDGHVKSALLFLLMALNMNMMLNFVKTFDITGYVCIMNSCENQQGEFIMVMRRELEPHQVDQETLKWYHNAVKRKYEDKIKEYAGMHRKVSVNSFDANGMAAVHHAAVTGDYSVFALLISLGGEMDIEDSNGWTPLHHAVKHNHFEMVEKMIKAGVPFADEDNDGKTPLDIAEENGHEELVEFMGMVLKEHEERALKNKTASSVIFSQI